MHADTHFNVYQPLKWLTAQPVRFQHMHYYTSRILLIKPLSDAALITKPENRFEFKVI